MQARVVPYHTRKREQVMACVDPIRTQDNTDTVESPRLPRRARFRPFGMARTQRAWRRHAVATARRPRFERRSYLLRHCEHPRATESVDHRRRPYAPARQSPWPIGIGSTRTPCIRRTRASTSSRKSPNVVARLLAGTHREIPMPQRQLSRRRLLAECRGRRRGTRGTSGWQ